MTALLLVIAACSSLTFAADGEPAKDPNPMQTYYQEALDYYAKGDLRRAVGKWNEVLKIDPGQKTAQSMILRARRRIEVSTEKRRIQTFALIGTGRYEGARLEIQALLDQDPGHPQIVALQDRLESVIKIAKKIEYTAKPARMAVIGLKGFLIFPQDLRLAYDGLRYAIELDPSDDRFKSFLELVLAQRPELAEDKITPGMKLMAYLQMVAVNDIYDGKYDRAIATLNEILSLEPKDVLALKRLGSAYFSLDQKKRARDSWERALRLQPNDPTLKKFLARLERSKDAPPTAKPKNKSHALARQTVDP